MWWQSEHEQFLENFVDCYAVILQIYVGLMMYIKGETSRWVVIQK